MQPLLHVDPALDSSGLPQQGVTEQDPALSMLRVASVLKHSEAHRCHSHAVPTAHLYRGVQRGKSVSLAQRVVPGYRPRPDGLSVIIY